MKDIARDLGISVVTVSKVMRNQPDVGPETRRKVWERAKALRYQPNFAARALSTGRSYTMALIVPGLIHPFFAEFSKSLGAFVRKKGYGLLISSSEEEVALERREIEQVVARGVDALVLASAQSRPQGLAELDERKVPYVLFDRRLDGITANFVGIDDQRAGYLGTKHLIEQGYRRIAHIGGGDVSTARGRLAGYRQALAEHGLPLRDQYLDIGRSGDDLGDRTGQAAMHALLARKPPPDAVFCYNDPVAAGAMRTALEAGLRIPQDLGMVGCGDTHFAPYLQTPLTSVGQCVEEMGRAVGKLALSLVGSNGTKKPKSVLFDPVLVVRRSSSGPGPVSTKSSDPSLDAM